MKEGSLFYHLDKVSCYLEFNCFPLDFKDGPEQTMLLDKSDISKSMVGERPRTATEKYANILRDNLKGIKLITNEKDRWHILSKELSQKQELIHRMLKEYDEKTDGLKMVGTEIIELRKQLRLLLSENQL